MSPAAIEEAMPAGEEGRRRIGKLRGVRWRIDLGILPPLLFNSSVDDLRRVTANSRRRYAGLRRRLLVDPHISKDGTGSPDLFVDNPLSQNPDSTWGRFFRNAELEKTVDQDLSRLYPEHGSYFQEPRCQGLLRRILLLWCLGHPEYGYRQGMHELLAPLLYVLHVDLEHLVEVQKLYEDLFNDKFDGLSSREDDLTYDFDYKKFLSSMKDDTCSHSNAIKFRSLDELDPEIQTIILLSDAYGAEGELGVVLSEKFLEHDAYSMFDALMGGVHGSVAMAEFFSSAPVAVSHSGLPAVIEASAAIYHLLSVVDSSLHSHLVELAVEPQYFALRWLRVLFGREFSFEDLLLIWDELFAADNSKIDKDSRDDSGSTFAIFSSSRGALISGIAVSMILHLRSSLLATENITTCLQRLLNFPENVEIRKLIDQAKAFQAHALVADASSLFPFLGEAFTYSRSTTATRQFLSSDLVSPKTPLNMLPDSYWEDKWRVLHKAEEQEHASSGKRILSGKRGWSEKLGSIVSLSRTESDPSSMNLGTINRGQKPSVRRSLLEDLSHQLCMDDDDVIQMGCSGLEDHQPKEILAEQDSLCEAVICTKVERRLSESASSEENSSLFSEACSSLGGANNRENDTEKSIFASNLSDENDNHSGENHEDSPLPVSHPPDNLVVDSGSNNEPAEKVGVNFRERKLLSGKLQWFWKFGRNAVAEGTSEKMTMSAQAAKSAKDTGHQGNVVGSSAVGSNFCDDGKEGIDKNVMVTLRNLGQSMLEHIQVIESVFQQDRGQLENSSKNVFVGKGQVTAVTALKELRKISNFLSEM